MWITESLNHRMAWVEKDHNDHLVSTPCYVQGHPPLDQAAHSHIQPGICSTNRLCRNFTFQLLKFRFHHLLATALTNSFNSSTRWILNFHQMFNWKKCQTHLFLLCNILSVRRGINVNSGSWSSIFFNYCKAPWLSFGPHQPELS